MATSDDDSEGEAPREPAPAGSFLVVGIGASAGGLEAVSALLHRTTIDNAAFIVVQHLAPNQHSMLAEILSRNTVLEVIPAADGATVTPNRVFVIPPNSDLAVRGGVLRVTHPAGSTHIAPAMPIDSFFRSLADDFGTRAIGVVLSGTGTDGTFGLSAIKAAGGITFAQAPDTAKFDGMPRSALESGSADFCLPPEEIADEILHVSKHPYLRGQSPRGDIDMKRLASIVKSAFGIDLMQYKPNTIVRRVQRRMAMHRIERADDYLRRCQNDAKELAALHRDLLINVTSFFRDREPYEALAREVLPQLVENKSPGDAIRIWVPGCASGEEAYSVGICLLELLDRQNRTVQIQLFGTDADAEAIHQARRGVYPENITADVSPERLRRFFVKTDDGNYQVCRRLRDLAVFSTQNLTRDAPFSRLDLVTCRNVLIYLQSTVQRKVMRLLHYALVPDGYLMLGNSESIGESSDLFTVVDRKNKIYSAKHVAVAHLPIDVGFGGKADTPRVERPSAGGARAPLSIAQVADRKILEEFAPAGVVVNQSLEIIYFRGRTSPYLEQPSGAATHSILRMIRPELHAALKRGIDTALHSGEPNQSDAQIKDDGGRFRSVTVIVQPLSEPETKARCLLVLFRQGGEVSRAEAPRSDSVTVEDVDERVRNLERELALTKEYLQSTVEELERTNEESRSANEELQSTNEELQSTNEELETSKEELQSTNEELITLNEELQNRMRDLSQSNDDLHNVLLGVDRPVIIVGLDLRIRRFTSAAERILNLIPGDVGRSVAHLNSFLGGAFATEKRVGDAISRVETVEEEVQAADEHWYSVRIVPYRTLDLAIRGAVITLVDIDVKRRRDALDTAIDEYAAKFLSAVPHPLLIVDDALQVVWANDVYFEVFGVLTDEVIGTKLDTLGRGKWSDAPLAQAVAKTARTGAAFRNVGMKVKVPGKGDVAVRVGGSRVRDLPDPTTLVLLSIEGDFVGGSPEA